MLRVKSFLNHHGIAFKEQVPIALLTGMGQDGRLPLVVYPNSVEQLTDMLQEVLKRNFSFDVFGGLTNTYLCSNYQRAVIIITSQVKDISFGDGKLMVGCGYNLTKLARELCKKGIAGYDGLIGIPGTVGAAAINNSSAFETSLSKVVRSLTVLDKNGKKNILSNADMQYSLRSSRLKHNNDFIVLSVELDISRHADKDVLNERISRQTRYRQEMIDGKRKSLGSVFVSPSLKAIGSRHWFRIYAKKICYAPLKLLFHSQRVNTWMDFLFLGHPRLARHCDSLNRFTWGPKTKESDFFNYINTMQRLADDKLELEIEIKR